MQVAEVEAMVASMDKLLELEELESPMNEDCQKLAGNCCSKIAFL